MHSSSGDSSRDNSFCTKDFSRQNIKYRKKRYRMKSSVWVEPWISRLTTLSASSKRIIKM